MKQITLGQSTVYMTAASIGQKIVSFIYFAIIARILGPEDTGKYFFALSFTTIFVVFIDLGLTNVMVREGAKTREKMSLFLSSVLFLKLFLGVATYFIMAVALYLFGYGVDIQTLVYISGITMLFDSLQLSLYGTLRALGNIQYEALGIVLGQALTLVLGTLFLYFNFPLYFLMIAFLVPSFLNTVFALYILRRRFKISFKPTYSKEILSYLVPIAIPFALAMIFGRVFSYSDSVMLSKIAGHEAVGWYSVPYKIAYAFQFIPFALIAGLYPRMSEYFAHDHKRLGEVFNQALRYLLVVSVPLSFGIVILSSDIIHTFFGSKYLFSIVPLQILMYGVVASFVNVLLGALLNATSRQKIQTTLIGIVMLLNVVLNFLFIPRFGVSGAAIAGTIGNIVLLIFSWIVIRKIITVEYKKVGLLVLKLLISTGGMSFVVWYTTGQFHVLLRALIGGIVFAALFALFKGLSSQDILYFRSIKSK